MGVIERCRLRSGYCSYCTNITTLLPCSMIANYRFDALCCNAHPDLLPGKQRRLVTGIVMPYPYLFLSGLRIMLASSCWYDIPPVLQRRVSVNGAKMVGAHSYLSVALCSQAATTSFHYTSLLHPSPNYCMLPHGSTGRLPDPHTFSSLSLFTLVSLPPRSNPSRPILHPLKTVQQSG